MEIGDNGKYSVIDLKVVDFRIERLKQAGHIDTLHIKTGACSNADARNLNNCEYQYKCANKGKYVCKCGRRILTNIVQRSTRK